MLELLKRLAPAIVLVLAFSFGMYVGSVTKDNEWKEEVHNEYVTKNEARVSTQREVDAVSKKYQEDYAALEGSTDGVINELVVTISGCVQTPVPPVAPEEVTVDCALS